MDKQRFTKAFKNKIPVRWHMSLICLTTIGSGILVSKGILLFTDMEPMGRYGIAVLFSYGVFFALVHLWLRIYFKARPMSIDERDLDAADVLDVDDIFISRNIPEGVWRGQGGNFSGGGASASWGVGEAEAASSAKEITGTKGISDLGDFDDGVVVLLALAVLAMVFGSAGYLIYQAPEILFEAAFEVILAAGLVKQTRKMKSEGWHYSVFKKTWWLCALVLIAAMLLGYGIKFECPAASSFAQYRELCWDKSKN